MEKVSVENQKFLDTQQKMKDSEREQHFQKLISSFTKLLDHGQNKINLATDAFDIVEKHIRRLDHDLQKFEEEQMTGPKIDNFKPEYSKYCSTIPKKTTPKSFIILIRT
jgi:hypothetical protein